MSESRKENGVNAPGMLTIVLGGQCPGSFVPERICKLHLPPDMPLHAHASNVASPIAASPAKALLQELDVAFQLRRHLCFLVVLERYLLMVGNQPTGDEIVIIGIELVVPSPAPDLVREAGNEAVLADNLRSIRNRPAR